MAAALLALAAAPANAQPCGTRTTPAPTLTAGQTVRGALAREDFTLPGDRYDGRDACTGRPYDSYFYEAQAGERLTFVLESREIDPEVTATTHWRGGGEKDVASERGRRGRTLTATGTVPAAGRILIQVASNVSLGRPGSTGDYTFTLRSNRPAGGNGGSNGGADGGAAGAGGTLRLGQSASGELTRGDGQLADDSYFDDYVVTLRRGERVTATLRSEAFDAFLHAGRRAADGTLENRANDDDSGGGTDARLTYTADRDGPVTIRVNTLSAGERGRYTLELASPGGAAPDDGTPAPSPGGIQTLQAGQTVRGELAQGDEKMDDDSFYDLYTYMARRGERIVVRMSSDDFDTVLGVSSLNGDADLENTVLDDDGGGGTNSRVEYTADRDGPLVIRANSLSGGETGRYTIVVESRRGSAAPAPADGAERVAARAAERSAGATPLARRTAAGYSLASPYRADARLGMDAARPLRVPGAPRRADPILSSRATAWLMAGVGVGMIFAGRAIEDTPAEPLGALVRYTGYAVVVFAPLSGG